MEKIFKLLSSTDQFSLFITGDWIYYSDSGYICKIKTDGSKKSRILKSTAYYINVVGDWIYYKEDWKKLSKVKIDGTGKKVLYDGTVQYLNVSGNMIYFKMYQGIYKMKTDGSGLQQITKGYPGDGLKIIDDKVYFIETVNQYAFYRMNNDGTNKVRLDGFKFEAVTLPEEKNGKANYFGNSNGNINNGGFEASQGDVMYYTIRYNNSSVLCKEKKDGSGRVMFAFGNAESINVAGDWIYYKEYGANDAKLFKIRTNGLNKTKLSDDKIFNLRVVGDWVYYATYSDIYRIKNDGTGKQKLISNVTDRTFNVSEDSIYCSVLTDKDDSGIYNTGFLKMDLDGSNQRIINGITPEYFCVDGEYIYSTGSYHEGCLIKMKLDG